VAKFLLIYRDAAEQTTPPSPEEMQSFLAMWGEWFAQCGTAIVDGGDAQAPTGRVLQGGSVVSDGPYVEGKEILGGYSVVQAESYEAAVEIAKQCPIAKIGGSIEIREFMGY
jgi:hypothetical protein